MREGRNLDKVAELTRRAGARTSVSGCSPANYNWSTKWLTLEDVRSRVMEIALRESALATAICLPPAVSDHVPMLELQAWNACFATSKSILEIGSDSDCAHPRLVEQVYHERLKRELTANRHAPRGSTAEVDLDEHANMPRYLVTTRRSTDLDRTCFERRAIELERSVRHEVRLDPNRRIELERHVVSCAIVGYQGYAERWAQRCRLLVKCGDTYAVRRYMWVHSEP